MKPFPEHAPVQSYILPDGSKDGLKVYAAYEVVDLDLTNNIYEARVTFYTLANGQQTILGTDRRRAGLQPLSATTPVPPLPDDYAPPVDGPLPVLGYDRDHQHATNYQPQDIRDGIRIGPDGQPWRQEDDDRLPGDAYRPQPNGKPHIENLSKALGDTADQLARALAALPKDKPEPVTKPKIRDNRV